MIKYFQISLLFLLLAFSSIRAEENTFSKFRKLSKPEKHWVILHPFVAKKAWRITKNVLLTVDSVKGMEELDNDINGGKLDAFKHSYWMAMLTVSIGAKKSNKLGIAHEKGNKHQFKNH